MFKEQNNLIEKNLQGQTANCLTDPLTIIM